MPIRYLWSGLRIKIKMENSEDTITLSHTLVRHRKFNSLKLKEFQILMHLLCTMVETQLWRPLSKFKGSGMVAFTTDSSTLLPTAGFTLRIPNLRSRSQWKEHLGHVTTFSKAVTTIENLPKPNTWGLQVLNPSPRQLSLELISVKMLKITERSPLQVASALSKLNLLPGLHATCKSPLLAFTKLLFQWNNWGF